MGRPTSLNGWLLSLGTLGAARRFERATRRPRETQRALLLSLLRKNAGTDYGRRHGFGSVRGVEEFQRRVPIVTYDDISEDVARMMAGENAVLTAERPIMFARTSGTTGTSKYIPVTPTCRGRAHRDVMKTWLHHAQRDHPDIFDARCVTLVSPAVEGYTSCGLPYGSTSGDIYRNQSAFVRRAYSIPYEAFEIEDYEAKYYAIMRLGVPEDVRLLCSANPSSILKLCEKADQYAELIIKDVHDGTLCDRFEIAPRIRTILERSLAPDAERARALESARERRGGRLLPADYWPSIALIGCWKGGTVGHYLDSFPSWFDPDGARPVAVRDWGYLSSEARGSIPLRDAGSAGVLAVATNFYEFVPIADVESAPSDPTKWTTLTATELQAGCEYYVILTTSGGLYRYDINDVVEVMAHHNETPEIVFRRKGRGVTSITGEKISVNQVIAAIDHASGCLGIRIDHFRVEADMRNSRYIFMVEPHEPLPPEHRILLLKDMDAALKDANIEYRAKRDSLRLGPPLLREMRRGWYERARRRSVARGRRQFQAKTILLAPDVTDDEAIADDLRGVAELED